MNLSSNFTNRAVYSVLAIFAFLVLASCGSDSKKSAPAGGGSIQSAFSINCFPLAVSDTYGDLAFDSNGDLLIADTGSSQILWVDHDTCAVYTVATIAPEDLISVVEVGNWIYAGSASGDIYKIDPSDGSWMLLASLGGGNDANSIVAAPAGYGAYGGQLIAAAADGSVFAVDQSLVSPTPALIADIGGAASDLVFGSDGTLYVAGYDDSKVVTLASDGTVSDFATGLNGPDGLAIDNTNSRLFIADSGTDTLNSAAIPAGTVTVLKTIDFGAGYFPAGLAYDKNGTLLMHSGLSGIIAQPVAFAPIDPSCFPLGVAGTTLGSGGYTFDANGDMLFTTSLADEVRKLDRLTCATTTVATNVSGGSQLLGLTYDADLNRIYVGATDSNIYTVNPSSGSSVLLTATAAVPEGLIIAPSGYGPYGDQLIVSLADGSIYAIDQSLASPTPALIVDIGGAASDLIFGADGTLYVAENVASTIVTVTPGGTTAVFAAGLNGPDGLAVDNTSGRLFVASENDDMLRQVTIPGGVVSVLGAADFDSGFHVSPIIYDGYDTLLMGLGEAGQVITAFGL